MIDPFLSLAISLHSKKGTYALLLGSGVSSAAEIPTGWDIVLELIRKLALLSDESCGTDPATWYQAKYGEAPDYSKLLGMVAKTPSERQLLLRGYFEPTEEDRIQGKKTPTIAHRAIARLTAAGYFKVVITTNFDQLLEKALGELGITPTVVSTPDRLLGALPLPHSDITILKVHGDYLDTRIRNTESEVGTYDPVMDRFLDRILDEYGLVVAGWSALWDLALRQAIERCPMRRFTTYWTSRSIPTAVAKTLICLRSAELIMVKSADSFFEDLGSRLTSLAEFDAPHPLSPKIAVASVKRFVVSSSDRIRLRDLVHSETERLISELQSEKFTAHVSGTVKVSSELPARLKRYEALSEILTAILVAGCYFGDSSHAKTWFTCLRRLEQSIKSDSGTEYLLKLRRYPLLYNFYAAGIAAVAAGNYATLNVFLSGSRDANRKDDAPYCVSLSHNSVMEPGIIGDMAGFADQTTPVSEYLYRSLRGSFRDYLPDDYDYEATFDRFEFLLGMTRADIRKEQGKAGWFGPVGRFGWKPKYEKRHIHEVIALEIGANGEEWPPVKSGMFGGSFVAADMAFKQYQAYLREVVVRGDRAIS